MMKFDRIIFTLLTVTLFGIFTPRIFSLLPYIFPISVCILTILVILPFIWQKSTLDSILAGIPLVTLLLVKFMYPQFDDYLIILRTTSTLAYVFLSTTLLIGPLSHYFKSILSFYKHRRHIGVSTFLLAMTHAQIAYHFFFSDSVINALSLQFVYFGMVSVYILFLLGITSWNWVQKHFSLRTWIIIHGIAFFPFLLLTYEFWIIHDSALTTLQLSFIIIAIFYWIAISPWALPQVINVAINGWKQVHILIYLAYFSVVIHAWNAMIFIQPVWVQFVFLLPAILVLTFQTSGLVLLIKDRLKQFTNKKLLIDNRAYYSLDREDSFQSGTGRKFIIEQVPIAVFKNDSKFFAVSDICNHQGGPIHKGKIVNGYVECPWHNWQYSVDDGCGPPGYPDCLSYFPILIKDGMVYVSLKRVRPIEKEHQGMIVLNPRINKVLS